MARSTRDLLNIVAEVREAGAGFKSLSDAWADTTTPHGRLLMVVLGGLAEFERDLIAARTGDGRVRAKARGVKFGRPPALTPHQRSDEASGSVRPLGLEGGLVDRQLGHPTRRSFRSSMIAFAQRPGR